MPDFTDGSIANGITQPACVLESKFLAASGVSAQHAGVARHSIVPCFASSGVEDRCSIMGSFSSLGIPHMGDCRLFGMSRCMNVDLGPVLLEVRLTTTSVQRWGRSVINAQAG